MAFNEAAFREKATAQGISVEEQDSFLKTQNVAAPQLESTGTTEAGTSVNAPVFNEAAFREKATAQGISVEEQDTFLASRHPMPDVFLPNQVFTSDSGVFTAERNVLGGVPLKHAFKGNVTEVPQLSREAILTLASEIGANPRTQEGINAIHSHSQRKKDWIVDKRQLLGQLQEISNVERPFQWIESNFDLEAQAEWNSLKQQNIENIAKLAEERGMELFHENGEFFTPDASGQLQHVTPELLEELGHSKFEALGGISGAILGTKAGSKVSKHPLAILAAGAAGAIGGTVLGEEVDYLSAAIQAQEQLDARIALEKGIGAAQVGALGEFIGAGAMKLTQAASKRIIGIYNMIRDDNTAGAYAALKAHLNLDDAQTTEIISRWENLNQAELSGSLAEKALQVIPRTEGLGDIVVRSATQENSRVAATIRKEVTERAQVVRDLAKNPLDNTGENLIKALDSYTNQVKSSYDIVKNQAHDLAPQGYRFDLEQKSLIPMLEASMDEIADPAVVERLGRVLTRVDSLTESRTFSDLLELRELLNEFKYANKITSRSKFKAGQAVTAARNEVDAEIEKVMKASEEGKQWLTDWASVNKDYGEFKMLQKNALFKAVRKPGATPKTISQALLKSGTAIDDTYTDVVSKLPVKIKAEVENELIDQLAQKHSIQVTEDLAGVNFPQLSTALKQYPLSSAKASQLKKTVDQLAEVYRNDPALSKTTPTIDANDGQTIATSLWGKAKMAGVNSMWRFLRRSTGTTHAEDTALVVRAAHFLENPLDAKVAEKVFQDVKDDEALTAAFKRMQAAAAKEIAEGRGAAKVKLFKDARTGKVYSKDGRRRVELTDETIPVHRTLRLQDVEGIIERPIDRVSDLSKVEQTMLLDRGLSALIKPDGQVIKLGGTN